MSKARKKKAACPLVLIEWEDSSQPIPRWMHLADFEAPGVIRCASVGWLICDDDQMKALAPNMGSIDQAHNLQVSGVIQIPTSCVIKVSQIAEPALSPAKPLPASDTKGT